MYDNNVRPELLLALNVCSPRFAQATRQAQATHDLRVAAAVTPGPTTMPPELTMTSSYTGPCDFRTLAVTLALTNTSFVNIVPSYGVTRFAYSVPFGLPGTTLAYGHDDVDGSILRYLARLKVGDAIGIAVGRRRLTYIVRSVSIVSPTDVRLLTRPRLRPTLALISCTPWPVDTQRVVVIAQIETRAGKAL
jgi:Sortase domain